MSSAEHAFQPPHCPNPACDFHRNSTHWRYKRDGFHFRRCDQRRIQRYLCSHCGRSFSSQTFSTTYWLKRPDLLLPLLKTSLACAGLRQMARLHGVSPTTVALHLGRAGRHSLAYHELRRPRTSPVEPLVIDGFETFEFSQYWITHLNTVVGAESHYVYATTVSELRRKGRMTRQQKERRRVLEARYGRPHPRSIEHGVYEALASVLPEGSSAVVRSDDHRQYPAALHQLPGRTIQHEITSSKAPRTPQNPLFPVNLYHLLLRHGGGNHKRETIAFSKRRQGALYRAAIWAVWRNYVKWSSEGKKTDPPAVQLGVLPRRLSVEEILSQRLFPWRQTLEPWVKACYEGRIRTRCLARQRVHRLSYAC